MEKEHSRKPTSVYVDEPSENYAQRKSTFTFSFCDDTKLKEVLGLQFQVQRSSGKMDVGKWVVHTYIHNLKDGDYYVILHEIENGISKTVKLADLLEWNQLDPKSIQ